jgi:murein L,D-transpeptidase YafK
MWVSAVVCLTALIACVTVAAEAGEPPSSSRSRAAIERVKPRLTEDLHKQGLRFGAPIFIRIFKESAQLEMWIEKESGFELFRVYDICTFSGDLGPKLRWGDMQSPEGFYFVNAGRLNPASQFHLSFNLGYPNAYDRHHGRTGSALMVHGNCVSIGCYAMTDAGIEEIYALADAALRAGQPFFRVHIFPFRMTDDNMQQHARSEWREFWENLKEGYDLFETTRRPPNVKVRGGKYVFEEP